MNRKLLFRKAIAIIMAFSGGMATSDLQAQYNNPVYSSYTVNIVPGSSQQVMVFKTTSLVTSTAFVTNFNSKVNLLGSSNSPLKLLKTETDTKGFTHNSYIQNISGVDVENAVVKTHVKSGLVKSASVFTKNITLTDVTPVTTSAQAKTLSLSAIGSTSEFTDARFKIEAPILIITLDAAQQHVLAWKVDVFGKAPARGRYYVYVNAKTGAIVKKISRQHKCGNPTVQTRYEGSKTINDNVVPPSTGLSGIDVLYDDCRNTCGSSTQIIETIYLDNVGQTYYYGKPTGTTWPSDLHHKTGFQIHYGLGKIYDYYKCNHGRNGFDNQNTSILGVAHFNTMDGVNLDPDNAAWLGGGVMVFGDGGDGFSGTQTVGSVTSMDVIGHEFTHGVTENTAGLLYEGESGALNEAWSDILGTDFEFYAKGTGNYTMGEEVWASGMLRSMSNPNARNQPDTYGGTYWQNTSSCVPDASNDYCGVHGNSGVANYWFYLLANGGSGTNDLGNAFSVSSITRDVAAKIAYRALVYHFTPNTNYAQARQFTILAAEDLYGQCSNEALQVAKAWYAVGVGANPVNSITGPTSVCPYQTNVNFAITANTGSTYTWTLPPNTSVVSGSATNSITINFNGTTPGARTISLNEFTSDVCVPLTKSITVLDAVANATTCDAYPKPLSPNGLSFDGTDDVAIIPAHSKMGLGLGDFTYEIIIKSNPSAPLATYGGQAEYLLGNYGDGPTGSAEFWTNRATCSTCPDYVSFRSMNSIVGISTNLRDNKCHHIAVVKNSTDTKMYMDGVLLATELNTRDFGPTGNGVNVTYIGGYYDANQLPTVYNAFNGSIKELRIWNAARTQTQIQNNMNRALYGSEAGLVAYYPFDETGTVETINDRIAPTPTLPLNSGYRGSSPSNTDNNPTAIAGTCTTVNTRMYNLDMPLEGAGIAENGIAAYPNPFSSELTFRADFAAGKTYSVELINSVGSVVYADKNLVSGASYSISTELTPGFYVLKCNDGNVSRTKTVIKY
ncbi:MAG: M4 family metallopeptidase [Sporocytophaga sp.]|uniref:M4 family metallopeptidase n=1 Tax=Sporocytophaga sp. TaxID=2231183 RepID=UPI001B1D4B4B|nr:M4 family metallopeptidase [Sporocytophaga sp.]MBO9702258.1 M4 family metallopeptidase [Sporocytophaga sp.]